MTFLWNRANYSSYSKFMNETICHNGCSQFTVSQSQHVAGNLYVQKDVLDKVHCNIKENS